jgi:hypothetical protein
MSDSHIKAGITLICAVEPAVMNRCAEIRFICPSNPETLVMITEMNPGDSYIITGFSKIYEAVTVMGEEAVVDPDMMTFVNLNAIPVGIFTIIITLDV